MGALALTDWINVGAGCLHCGPFLARCFLIRLFDIDSAILVYHEPTVSCTTRTEDETKTVISMVGHHKSATAIHLYWSRSADAELSELLEGEQTTLPLTPTPRVQVGRVVVRVSPCRLSIPAGWGLALGLQEEGQRHEYPIEGTGYCVISPVQAKKLWQTTSPEWSRTGWEIALAGSDGEDYSLQSKRPWSLGAFEADRDWNLTVQLFLTMKEKLGCAHRPQK